MREKLIMLKYNIIGLIFIMCFLIILLRVNVEIYKEETKRNEEILKVDIVQIEALSDSVIVYEKKLKKHIIENEFIKDSLTKEIKVKEFKFEAAKGKIKNEEVYPILYDSDSSILYILSEDEI